MKSRKFGESDGDIKDFMRNFLSIGYDWIAKVSRISRDWEVLCWVRAEIHLMLRKLLILLKIKALTNYT